MYDDNLMKHVVKKEILEEDANKLFIASRIIKEADAILITAGAGMGVDSGLPDFRGNEGFWKAYPVIKDLGYRFSEMANPSWFKKDPQLAWAFYGHRLHLYRDTNPHAGFSMLFDLLKEKNEDYFIYTSNVDGQFQKAGFDEKKIVEIHGSIHHTQCSGYCKRIKIADDINLEIDMKKFKALNVPTCKKCNAVLRPNILMFGDSQWNDAREHQQLNRYNKWISNIILENKRLVIIEVGAGENIPTIRHKGEDVAESYEHAILIRINPKDYHIDKRIGISLALGGLEGIKILLDENT